MRRSMGRPRTPGTRAICRRGSARPPPRRSMRPHLPLAIRFVAAHGLGRRASAASCFSGARRPPDRQHPCERRLISSFSFLPLSKGFARLWPCGLTHLSTSDRRPSARLLGCDAKSFTDDISSDSVSTAQWGSDFLQDFGSSDWVPSSSGQVWGHMTEVVHDKPLQRSQQVGMVVLSLASASLTDRRKAST